MVIMNKFNTYELVNHTSNTIIKIVTYMKLSF